MQRTAGHSGLLLSCWRRSLNSLILGFLSIELQTHHSLFPRAVIAGGVMPPRLGVFVHSLTWSFIHSADYLLPGTCCEPGPRLAMVNTTLLFLFLTLKNHFFQNEYING